MQEPTQHQPDAAPPWAVLWKRRDGFQARLARRFNLARQTINDWGRHWEIPVDCCAGVEEECKGEFRRWHFYPRSWWEIWPELMLEPGAPDFPAEALQRYLDSKCPAPAASNGGLSSLGAVSSPPA